MIMDNIKILGFNADIASVGETLSQIDDIKKDGEIIQLLNADAIAGKNHIIHGVNQAFLAFDRGENLAKDISVEIVVRCSAQRQISCIDYSNDLSNLFDRNDDVLSADVDKLKEIYKIGDVELENMSAEDILVDRITKLTVDY